MQPKLLQFDGKKWLNLDKTNLVAMATKKNPYIFVVVDSGTAKIGRSTSVLHVLLNVTNSKKQIFMQKHAQTGTISKMRKKLPKCIVSTNRKFVSRQQL